MLNKTNAHGNSVGIFFVQQPRRLQPPGLGVQNCRRSQNYSVFFATCDLLHWILFWGSQEKEAAVVPLGKQNCRRSQTLCFYCYFRSSAICVTFRFAEPRQSSNDPYIKKPSVSWDREGLQGILAENALHKMPPSNKYRSDLEGA